MGSQSDHTVGQSRQEANETMLGWTGNVGYLKDIETSVGTGRLSPLRWGELGSQDQAAYLLMA